MLSLLMDLQRLAFTPVPNRGRIRCMRTVNAFGLTRSFLRSDTDSLYPPTHHNDSEGGNMTNDRTALLAIATRIAEAENRVAQLRERVERLKFEGSDASQAQDTLQVVSRNLGNLYVQQSVMRRTVWAWQFRQGGIVQAIVG
jgi:uncharacterized small protein (DUF1192 family)